MRFSRRTALRAGTVALIVAILQALTVTAPAMACACGALEPSVGDDALVVNGETALVRHDGSMEDILLSFGMGSDADSAALILPLPAKATLSLADVDTFARLAELTQPVVVEERVLRGLGFPTIGGAAGDGAGAPGGGVDVLEERELGPFTTTQLDSDDASDLQDWLEEHDYRVRDNIVAATQPYLDEGWVIAAIQLKPGAQDSLGGDLQPIHASFASDKMVYPMRLQAQASESMPLRVYSLSKHRQDMELGSAAPEVKFAGSLADTSLRPGSTLADLAEDTPYLTRHDLQVSPEQATTDVTFTAHEDDTAFREERTVEVDYPWYVRIFVPSAGTFAFWVVVLPPVLLTIAFIWGCVRLIRGPRRPRAGVQRSG